MGLKQGSIFSSLCAMAVLSSLLLGSRTVFAADAAADVAYQNAASAYQAAHLHSCGHRFAALPFQHLQDQVAWSVAAISLGEFVRAFPDNSRSVDAMYFEAEAYSTARHYPAATAAYGRFVSVLEQRIENEPVFDSQPNSSVMQRLRRARFRWGESAYMAKQSALAWQTLNDFHQRYPDDPMSVYALPYLGDLARQNNDLDAARAFFTTALLHFKSGPRHFECQRGLARCEPVQQPNPSQDAIVTRPIPTQSMTAQKPPAQQAQPSTEPADTGSPLKASLENGLASVPPSRRPQFQLCFAEGQRLVQQGDFETASVCFRQTLNDPASDGTPIAAQAQMGLGELLYRQGNTESALDEFLRVEVLHTAGGLGDLRATALMRAAECYEKLERSSAAAATYARVLRRYPQAACKRIAAERIAAATGSVRYQR